MSVSIEHDHLPSTRRDAAALRDSILEKLVSAVGKEAIVAQPRDWLMAAALAVRDRFVGAWMNTANATYQRDVKRVYFLSVEYLIGRVLENAIVNLGIREELRQALADLDLDYEEIMALEPDPALGNGGLGRLAACYLDSMATLGIPGYAYGIRYEFGLFKQGIEDGHQVEMPENWLRFGNPWEFPRPEVLYPICFGGHVVEEHDASGAVRMRWAEAEQVLAMAYDTPIVGWQANTVNNLRLWAAMAAEDLNLESFNRGDYLTAVENKVRSENLSRVLYPHDATPEGKELRLRQEYFFVSASVQDILRRHIKKHGTLDSLAEKATVQLNDTHPSLAIPELMHRLVDIHGMAWDRAWAITQSMTAYTNHTLLPEALEAWPVGLLERLLPRHMQIIFEINHRFLLAAHNLPAERRRPAHRLSLIEEGGERQVRMGQLAFLGSSHVNGVSALHTQLMRDTVFHDMDKVFPERILNVTNGITPRRWLGLANPDLAALCESYVGPGWQTDLPRLAQFAAHVDDSDAQAAMARIKHRNKERLVRRLAQDLDIQLDPHALFDIQVKRIHEYKRQLLNILDAVARYNEIRTNPEAGWQPRTKLIAGKAASSYAMAKLIIKLANDVAERINNDPVVSRYLKMAFVPNFNVTTAEYLIPAADLSEQISTAGKEASGTGNMKLALNGALTIGTLDGANIEIRDAVGTDNIFIFGMSAAEVAEKRANGDYDPVQIYESDPALRQVIDQIGSGYFSPDDPDRYRPLVDNLLHGGDIWFVLADFAAYRAAQQRVDATYADPAAWWRRAIINTAAMGYFSSDRAVTEYAEHVWGTAAMGRTGPA